ncbi:MAG: DUF6263 family protein [Ignavibacteriaceae bacterium]|jgi:hypothetical protein
MKHSILKIAAVLSVLFFLSANVFAQETFNLQYKFSKGSTYLYNSDIASQLTQEVMGKEMKFGNDIHGVIRFLVDDVEDNGDIQFTASMDSATLKSNMMGKDTSISLSSLIGKRVKAVLSSFGEVKSCTMIDSVEENSNRMMSVPQEIKRFFTKFAGKDLKIGESWNSSEIDTIKNYGGTIISNVDMTCTLSGKENKLGHECFIIPFSGKLKISGKGNMQGMDFTMEGDGTSSGTIYFDGKTGLLVYSEGSMENDMTMATTGGQSMVIPITQNIKYTQTLINR